MGKTVLITGCSSGFGKAATKFFSAKGWNVIATMRSPEKEEELTQLPNVLVTKLDVQDSATIAKAVEEGVKRFATIDVLVNNAGYALMGTFQSVPKEQIEQQFAVNVFGLMDVTRATLPYLRASGHGVLINITSMGGRITLPTGQFYHATKFAIEGFSEALAYELSAVNVAVKIVEPGSVSTNFTAAIDFVPNQYPEYDELIKTFMGRYRNPAEQFQKATAEDVAATIYQAATDGTDQLRYLVGEDAKFFIAQRTDNPDQEYVKIMRDRFIGRAL
jgi:NAD(P)-dependent dehydrogenase (short-subunit alcohol dehydrogenase family)